MTGPPPYFQITRRGGREVATPLESAASGWSAASVRGPAVSGVLARAAEHVQLECGRDDLRPVRWTVDLSAPTAMRAHVVRARVLQQSTRLLLVSADLECDHRTTAHARALFLKPTVNPGNDIWGRNRAWELPPAGLEPAADQPSLFASDGSGWSADRADVQDGTRKRAWHEPLPIVEGESISRFQAVASIADLASLVSHWGARGIAHINADITVAIARLPTTLALGLVAEERVEHDGIAIGTATMHDGQGTIGTVVTSALANAARTIDLQARTRLGEPR